MPNILFYSLFAVININTISLCNLHLLQHTHTHTHTHTGRPVAEETFTHSHPSWSTDILYHLPPFTTIHGILFVQFTSLILIIIGIPSPTYSFTLGLNPSFSANPPHRSLSFFSFRIHYMDFPDCLLLLLSISVFLLFFCFFTYFFSCRFRAVD